MKRIFYLGTTIFISVSYYLFGLAGGAGLEFDDVITRSDYNPSTVGSYSGTIQEVHSEPRVSGMGNAVILKLSVQGGSVYVITAPDWYLSNQKIEFKQNQRVSVEGSEVPYKDQRVVIASSITHNGKTVNLRDPKSGKPVWSEWRKGEEIFYKNY